MAQVNFLHNTGSSCEHFYQAAEANLKNLNVRERERKNLFASVNDQKHMQATLEKRNSKSN